MSIRIAGDMAKLARREAMDEAAAVAERVGDQLMREAMKYHDAEEPNYDLYEDGESRASLAYHIAGRIRRRARRTPKE